MQKNPPCNKCVSCISITDGSNLDLIEIDAASNRGIEDIRILREKIKLSPTSSSKKVYIIDEAHMLTQEAFNALLKTLEEPPNHALFILATTDVQKVPPTIISRCQRLDFSLATPNELKIALERIIKEEKIDIEEEALQILIKKAEGSFRDGVKMLDQLASKNGEIKKEDVLKAIKSLDLDNLEVLLINLSQKRSSDSLMEVQKLMEGGADVKESIVSLTDMLRNIMLIKNGLGEILIKPNVTQDKYERLIKLSENFENQEIIRNLDILQEALEKLKFASIPELPLELAVLEICQLSVLGDQLSDKGQSVISQSVTDKQKTDKPESVLPKAVGTTNRKLKTDNSETNIQIVSESNSPDIAKLKEKWNFVLETIRPYNFSLEALLRSTTVADCTDTTVIMEVPYSFHQRILEAPKNRDLLEGVLSDVLGREIRVSAVLGIRPPRKEDIANIEVAQDDEIVRIASEIFNSDSVRT